MRTKHLLLLMACLTGLVAFVACSEGDEYGEIIAATPDKNNIDQTELNYKGEWSFTNGSKTLHSKVSTSVWFNPQTRAITLWSMPNDLIRQIIGWEGDVIDYQLYDYAYQAKAYETIVQEKGYSSSTQVYSLNPIDYMYPFLQDEQQHKTRVVFDNTSELAINDYTAGLTLVLNIKEIYLDDQLMATDVGSLVLEASQPTKSQEM